MTPILIYQDYVHNNGALYKALSTIYGVSSVGFADATDIQNGILTSSIKAFFMPGGASRYVADKLDGIGNQKIKEYVAAGGLYVGICAGAYYACQRIEWCKDQKNEICVDNELSFFPGTAAGPIAEFIKGDDMATIVHTDQGKLFYWAGPTFISDSNAFDVLARYSDLPNQPAAIVSGAFGEGRYLLSSPHIEIDSEQLSLMDFTVGDNRYGDIARMDSREGISSRLFTTLLQDFIGSN